MAIVQGDLLWFLTGASSHENPQSDPDASLGNYISNSGISTGVDNNVFDDVSGDEADSGDTEYRGIGFHNNHGSLDLTDAVAWIQVDTGNGEDDISIWLEAPTANEVTGAVQTIGNESTEPTGASGNWSDGTTKGTGEACPNSDGHVETGEWFCVWLQRVISASASAAAAETVTIRVEGDTAA